VTIIQLPSWWPLARRMRETFDWPVVYDCMDFHADFATARRAFVAEEKELLASADLVTVSSASLEEHARRYRNDVVMVRNGCDYEHFAQTLPARNARPVIGYYGAISDWFDSDLVAELAARRPEWDFILVGSTFNGDLSRLRSLPNVSLPGEEPYEALPEWLGSFDVTILPFRRTPLTEATNPVKLYEILAAGRPLVSVPIPEVVAVAPLVRLANDAREFEREIEAALAEDGSSVDARRAFARRHTWQQRYETLSVALDSVVPHD
jgi:O-antigen biosynthesis protein